MSKRNFILLIIVLVLGLAAVFGFLYFRKSADKPEGGEEGTNFISQFNPFGTKPAPSAVTPPVDVSGYEPGAEETQKMNLAKVSSMPIAGLGVFAKERLKDVPIAPVTETPANISKNPAKPTPPPTEFVSALRYVDRATGNIYQTFADKIEERKFSTTVIPGVYEAYFGNRGESVVMRYLKKDERTIETFVGKLPKELLGGDST